MNVMPTDTDLPQAEFIAVSLASGIATIVLNRPDSRNAINDQMRAELIAAFEWADSSSKVRAVVLTGAGKGFCAGGDVKGMHDRLSAPVGDVAFNGWKRQKSTHRGIAVIHHMSKPVIAAVNGSAVGLGLDMAMACDFIIAADGARMAMSFVRRGLVSDGGGMYFLPRRVGLVKAKELILTGRDISTDEALVIGLVDRVCPAQDLLEQAQAWADELSQGSVAAIALTKAILDQSLESTADQIFALGREAQAICYTTSQHRALVEDFLSRKR